MNLWLQTIDKKILAGDTFAALLRQPGIVQIPGAHSALAGLLAKEAGFRCLYVSGAAITADKGLPDLGIITMDELCDQVRSIARATDLPLIADGDTGYGETINVMRLVKELEEAGAAAVQIEDQMLPKKCGHLNDKRLISAEQMALKISAARAARTHLRIIARTDAATSEGVGAVIERARLYLEAGADAIFPEALTSREDLAKVATAIDAPLLANMTEFGKTPYLSAREFEELGYKMVIWPVSSLRVAAKAVEEMYRCLFAEGTLESQLDRMLTRKRLYEVISYHDYEALDSSIVSSVAP
ncbi:MAG: methylisocitrate lyase [Desulfuromonadales bacterium]